MFALESTIVTSETVKAMSQGIKTQKNILDINEAQKVTDDLHDSMADMEELQAVSPHASTCVLSMAHTLLGLMLVFVWCNVL